MDNKKINCRQVTYQLTSWTRGIDLTNNKVLKISDFQTIHQSHNVVMLGAKVDIPKSNPTEENSHS